MSAEIFDRGYRRYDGLRTGVKGAVRTLIIMSVQRTLGLRRPARYKVAPFTVIAIAFIPALVFVGISALIPQALAQEFVPAFSSYFSNTTTALFLFASFVGADLLCADRRSGMLGVYLSSPLTRPLYLLAKAVASIVLMLFISLLPNLTFMIALSLQGFGPDGFTGTMRVLLQIIGAALMIAVYYTAVSMAIASTTQRSTIAITTTLGVLVGSAAISSTITDQLGGSVLFRLFNLFQLPVEIAPRLFGDAGDWSATENPTWTLVAAWLLIIAVSAAVVWSRYRRLAVSR